MKLYTIWIYAEYEGIWIHEQGLTYEETVMSLKKLAGRYSDITITEGIPIEGKTEIMRFMNAEPT